MTRTTQVVRADGSADAPGPVQVFDSQGRAKLNVWSGAATDGQVLTADGSGGAAWEASAGGSSELLMQDGVTAPPVPIETEAQDDWLYED